MDVFIKINEYLSYFNRSKFLFAPSALPFMFVLCVNRRKSALTDPQVEGGGGLRKPRTYATLHPEPQNLRFQFQV